MNIIKHQTKLDRIAVVVIGYSKYLGSDELREKSNLHKHYHNFFNSFAKTVDYYILSWQPVECESKVPTSNLYKLLWPNLNYYNLFDDTDFYNTNETVKLSFLAKMASEQIKKTQIDYDYVIELTSDLFITRDNSIPIWKLYDNEIVVSGADFNGKKWDSIFDRSGEFNLNHWYFRMNLKTYFSFSERYDFFINNPYLSNSILLPSFFENYKNYNFNPNKDWADILKVNSLNDVPQI
jgi:hypothetical protein